MRVFAIICAMLWGVTALAEPLGRDVLAPLIVPPMALGDQLNDLCGVRLLLWEHHRSFCQPVPIKCGHLVVGQVNIAVEDRRVRKGV